MDGPATYSDDVLGLNPELRAAVTTVPASKYHNARTEAKGMRFQSGKEAVVVSGLILLEEQKAGVFGLRLQVRIPIGENDIYVADATYFDEALKVHIIDAKGYRTREYLRKRRLFKKYYGQDIEEL